jgi:hypothetical protein
VSSRPVVWLSGWPAAQQNLVFLYAAPNDYEVGEDCDGTITFTPEKGPVIMFGPSCDPPRTDHDSSGGGDSGSTAGQEGGGGGGGGGGGVGARVGDAARIGFATASNASDPELIEWTKGTKAASFDGEPCSFPGKIWKAKNATTNNTTTTSTSSNTNGASGGGGWNMLCSAGGTWARYSSAGDSLLGPWKLQDHSFATVSGTGKSVGGGNGGASFLPLPQQPAAGAAPAGGGDPTHIIADGANAVFQYLLRPQHT